MVIKVLFVCHGNTCRSPMAELIFRHLVNESNNAQSFFISSAATSTEDINSPINPKSINQLKIHNIPVLDHYARQIVKQDYDNYDYIIGMDSQNITNMFKIFPSDKNKKIYKLLDFSNNPHDIADPWYSNNFEKAFADIYVGCQALLADILNKTILSK